MNPVVHFEMPAEDKKRMTDFYANTFGWQMQMLGPDMGDYVLATTTETKDGMPKNPGAINGGFYKKSKDVPAQHPTVVIAVDDIKASVQKVTEEGGRVIGKPDDIPGVGKFVYFEDTEGNIAGMLQPLPME